MTEGTELTYEIVDTGLDVIESLRKRDGVSIRPQQSAAENPRLEFRNGQFFFRSTLLEGGLVERYLSDAAVREAFSKIPIDSGWLNPEIARWGDGKLGEWAVAFFPPSLYDLEVTREGEEIALDRIRIPLPGMVFFGIGTNYFAWAVKSESLQPFHEIFRAPLPNVYTSGAVCWGLVTPPRANARSLFQAWDLFIRSTFNNHLANGKSKRSRDDVRIILRELAGPRDPVDQVMAGEAWHYPVEDLVRQVEHVGVTLDKALREFFETGEMPE